MTEYEVLFSLEAEEQLAALLSYIALHSSDKVAAKFCDAIFCDAIVEECESLCTLPHRGQERSDIRPPLRVMVSGGVSALPSSSTASECSSLASSMADSNTQTT